MTAIVNCISCKLKKTASLLAAVSLSATSVSRQVRCNSRVVRGALKGITNDAVFYGGSGLLDKIWRPKLFFQTPSFISL